MYGKNPFVQLSGVCVDTAGEAKDMRALLWGDDGVICKKYPTFLVDLYV